MTVNEKEKGKVKIMVVDDEEDYLIQLRSHLNKLDDDFSIDTFSSPDKALNAFIAGDYDIVVSDYHMPGMDGFQFLQALKENDIDIPFIFLTGRGEEKIAAKALNLGADGYINKNSGLKLVAKDIHRNVAAVREKRDITDALKESQRMLSTLMSNLPGMAYRCKNDKQWTMKFVSEGCFDLTGYHHDELLDNRVLSFAELMHPDDVSFVEEAVKAALKNNEPFKLTYRIFSKDGKEKWVWEQGSGVRDVDDNIEFLEGFITDITETKTKEKERKESEEKYRNLIERANDGIAVVQDAELKYVNPRLAQMLGYSVDDILKTPFAIYIAPDELPKVSDRYKKRIAGKDVPQVYDTTLLKKDGSRLDVELNAGIIDYEGKPADFVFIRDITKRKQAEKALKDSERTYVSIYETMLSIAAEEELSQVIKKIADEATELLEASDCTVYLGDTTKEVLVPIYSNHKSYSHEIMDYEIPFGKGITGNAFRSEKTIYLNYDEEDPYSIHIPGTNQREDQYESVVSTPLLHNNNVIGVLSINKLKEKFDESDVKKLNIFAKQAELALKKAEDRDKLIASQKMLRKSEVKIKKLHDVAMRMKTASGEEELFNLVKDAARRILDFKVCSIDMVEDDELVVKATIGGVQKEGTRYPIEGVAGQTYEERESFLIADIEKEKKAVPKSETYKSAISIPIGIYGVFQALSEELNHFDEKDLELTEILVSHLTLSLERIRHEHELREKDERFQSLANSAPSIIYMINNDEHWSMTYINDAVESVTGYPKELFLKGEKSFSELYLPEDKDGIYRDVQDAVADKKIYHLNYRIVHADGSIRWMEEYGDAIREDGEIQYFVGIVLDITERRIYQEGLKATKEFLRNVMDTIPVRVFWKDRESIYLGCNKPFAKDAGLELPTDILGKDDFQLGWREQAELYRSDDKQVMESAEPKIGYEEPQTTPDGKKIWLRTSKVPLKDPNGETIGVLGTYEDITEQKYAEEELRKYKDHLEELVKERTAELAEVNKELESFAYSVSHDLRAPLRAIEGFGQALLEDYKGSNLEQVEEYSQKMVDAAERMDALILDLLAYSRMTTNEINITSVSSEDIVVRVMDRLDKDIEDSGAEITIEKPLPDIKAHPSTMVRILTNIVNNAIKYVKQEEHPVIKLRGEKVNDNVRIWIEDKGIGIAPENTDHIFEIFERLHGRETYPGTGIGLAIVKKGVERMGGRVGVESELGKGSRFWIELPGG